MLVDRVPRAAQPCGAPSGPSSSPVSARVGAEQQPGQLGAAGAEQPGEADHLALEDVEVDGLERALAAQAERLQHRGRRTRRRRWRRPRGRGARAPPARGRSSSRTSSSSADVRGHVLPDQRAVAQHRHPVGDLVDLVEEVRDEHDRDALRRAACASPRTAWRPRRRPGWRWARRGSAPGRRRPRRGRSRRAAGRRSGAAPSIGGRVDVEAEALEGRRGPAVHRPAVDAARTGAARGRAACSRPR